MNPETDDVEVVRVTVEGDDALVILEKVAELFDHDLHRAFIGLGAAAAALGAELYADRPNRDDVIATSGAAIATLAHITQSKLAAFREAVGRAS